MGIANLQATKVQAMPIIPHEVAYLSTNINDLFYTQNEAANRLNVDRTTVWRWIRAGKLEAQKVGGAVLIEKEVVEALHSKGKSQ